MTEKKADRPEFPRTTLIFLFLFFGHLAFSQVSTKNNFQGIWVDPSSWDFGTQPDPLTININDGIVVNGYITREGDLSFANVNQSNDFVISDTLVIEGNLTFENKAANLKIPTGGILIVLSNFTADNKIEVENGGLLIISGDMKFSNSNHDEYVDSGGGLYVNGTVDGNVSADNFDQPFSELINDGYPDIYDFVTSNGATPLPVELTFFNALANSSSTIIRWSTSSELNNDFFTLERSRNGQDFEIIAQIEGNGTTHVRSDYSFIDHSPYLGLSYYRLSQTDYDGTKEIFPAISAMSTRKSDLSVYPNPTSGSEISLKTTGKRRNEILEFNLLNLHGDLIMSKQLTADALGNLDVDINIGDQLNRGAYILEFVSAEGKEYLRLLHQ